MSLLHQATVKLVQAGDPQRRSRLHTLTGDRAPLSALADLPLCLAQTLLFKVAGRRPTLPWIPYAAIRHLSRRISRDWRVLEIGSGMSTLWLAERCGRIDSVEADERWVGLLRAEIARRELDNVTVHYRWRADEMCDFRAWPDASLDLVVVDGGPRPECFTAALPKVKPGGCIYLDNTDVTAISQDAGARLQEAARQRGGTVHVFRGLVPCNLFVNEGMLLQLPPAPA